MIVVVAVAIDVIDLIAEPAACLAGVAIARKNLSPDCQPCLAAGVVCPGALPVLFRALACYLAPQNAWAARHYLTSISIANPSTWFGLSLNVTHAITV